MTTSSSTLFLETSSFSISEMEEEHRGSSLLTLLHCRWLEFINSFVFGLVLSDIYSVSDMGRFMYVLCLGSMMQCSGSPQWSPKLRTMQKIIYSFWTYQWHFSQKLSLGWVSHCLAHSGSTMTSDHPGTPQLFNGAHGNYHTQHSSIFLQDWKVHKEVNSILFPSTWHCDCDG